MQSKLRGIGSVLVLALALLGVLLWGLPHAADAQSGVSNFTTVAASRDVIAGRDVILDGFLTLSPMDTQVLTNNDTLNPTGTLVPLSATLSAGIGLSGTNIAVQPAGTLLVLYNTGVGTITLTETGTLISAGNIVLGPDDTAILGSDGANWVMLSGSNN